MSRLLIFGLLALLAASCAPCRRLSSLVSDSVRRVTIVRTTERLVRDTAFVAVPAQSERRRVRDTVSYLENDFACSHARVFADGTLDHDLRTKPRLWPVPVLRRDTETVRTDTVYRDRHQREIVEMPRPLTRWQRMQMRGFWMLLALAGLWLWFRRR